MLSALLNGIAFITMQDVAEIAIQPADLLLLGSLPNSIVHSSRLADYTHIANLSDEVFSYNCR